MCGWLRTHQSYQTSCRLLIVYINIYSLLYLRVILAAGSSESSSSGPHGTAKGAASNTRGKLSGTGPEVDANPPHRSSLRSPAKSRLDRQLLHCFGYNDCNLAAYRMLNRGREREETVGPVAKVNAGKDRRLNLWWPMVLELEEKVKRP